MLCESRLGNLQKEHAVCETRKGIDFAITVREPGIWAPFAHDCSGETHSETSTIEEHVDTICEQSQGAADKAVKELNHHES